MSAAESPPSAPPERGTILYPRSAADSNSGRSADEGGGSGSFILMGAFLLALAGGWLLIKRRGGMGALRGGLRTDRKIVIEETRSLGNRQYLVVAGCEGRRFLLGVTQGQIQLLSPLDNDAPASSAEMSRSYSESASS